ncbi:MAG: hypothetical protein NZL91_02280 [Thermoflexales bacterium]|nr:hypothetical protein [Thermoflexales bacterium]MCS7325517.1 hypothetical protein [Thermoflexales bacterium]MCX7938067.1 hypothetical protein [Thermoflexales bacterium]MDW8053905.1 light-harvesting protein [Anaerolineae bacterium]MDW8292447.1 light-harvesting protein [Anaerolineae bacterium]
MNDKVPERWRPIFTNEEWIQHQLVVAALWMFNILAGIVHIILFLYKPWIDLTPGR